jgi:outer membrane protein OmpA-like peptidoglycan-associated protein
MSALRGAGAALAVAAGFACASAPLELESVRAEYAAAAEDPELRTQAAVELYEAKRAVEAAESAWQDQGDPLETRHRAYLADRRIEIARIAARRRTLEANLEQMPEERDRILQQAQERENAELERMLGGLGARYVQGGVVLPLSDAVFEANREDLGPEAARDVSLLARYLRAHPERGVVVEGHSDSRGAPERNLELSQSRADAVKDYLVANGVPAEHVLAVGYGSSHPVASNDSEEGRRRNRRVEILVLRPGMPLEPRRTQP